MQNDRSPLLQHKLKHEINKSEKSLRKIFLQCQKQRQGLSFNLDCRKYIFSNRVINEWNEQTEDILAGYSVNSFNVKIDIHLKSLGFIYVCTDFLPSYLLCWLCRNGILMTSM